MVIARGRSTWQVSNSSLLSSCTVQYVTPTVAGGAGVWTPELCSVRTSGQERSAVLEGSNSKSHGHGVWVLKVLQARHHAAP
eukprot:364686-Chlamydomonas_euryale.AAC.3